MNTLKLNNGNLFNDNNWTTMTFVEAKFIYF